MNEQIYEKGIASLTNVLVSLFLCKNPALIAGKQGSIVMGVIERYSLTPADYDLCSKKAIVIARERIKANVDAIKSVCF